jgi:hypothetical protein
VELASPPSPPTKVPRPAFVAAAAAALFFALYAKTCCPGAYWQDSGVYVRSVLQLGNCYPPGYPTYLGLAHLFASLPGVGAVAGLNLFSAAAGAALAFFLVLICVRLLGGDGYAAAGGATAVLALGTAPAVWAQATAAEVYTLSLALTAATIYLLLAWGGGSDGRPLAAAAFVYGLACGVHPQQPAFLPAYLLYVAWAGGRRLGDGKVLAVAAAAFLAAFSAYLYLPLRSAAGVLPDWGKPVTLANFYYHLSGEMYRSELFTGSAALVAARARVAADLFQSQFGWVGLAAGALGAIWLFRRRLREAVLTFGGAAVAVAFILNYYSANWRTWYASLYLVWALAAGAFVAWLCRRLGRLRPAAGVAAAVAAVVVAAALAVARFGPADRSYFPYAEEAAANLFRVTGAEATYILGYEGSAVTGPLATVITAAVARPDVRFVDAAGTRQFDDFFDYVGDRYRRLPHEECADRYVEAFMALVGDRSRDYYVLYPFRPAQRFGYGYEKRGRLWRLRPPGEAPRRGEWWALYLRAGVEPQPPPYVDYWTGTFLGVQYVDEARDRNREGHYEREEVCLDLARHLGRRAEKVQHNLGRYAEAQGDPALAAAHYRAALALEPTYRRPREDLAKLYARLGEEDKAARELEILSRLYPGPDAPR